MWPSQLRTPRAGSSAPQQSPYRSRSGSFSPSAATAPGTLPTSTRALLDTEGQGVLQPRPCAAPCAPRCSQGPAPAPASAPWGRLPAPAPWGCACASGQQAAGWRLRPTPSVSALTPRAPLAHPTPRLLAADLRAPQPCRLTGPAAPPVEAWPSVRPSGRARATWAPRTSGRRVPGPLARGGVVGGRGRGPAD